MAIMIYQKPKWRLDCLLHRTKKKVRKFFLMFLIFIDMFWGYPGTTD